MAQLSSYRDLCAIGVLDNNEIANDDNNLGRLCNKDLEPVFSAEISKQGAEEDDVPATDCNDANDDAQLNDEDDSNNVRQALCQYDLQPI